MITYRRGNILNTEMTTVLTPLTLRECRYSIPYKLGIHKCILSELGFKDRRSVRGVLKNSRTLSDYTIDIPRLYKPRWNSDSDLIVWIPDKNIKHLDRFCMDRFFNKLSYILSEGHTKLAIPNFCKYHKTLQEADFIYALEVFLKVLRVPNVCIELWNFDI